MSGGISIRALRVLLNPQWGRFASCSIHLDPLSRYDHQLSPESSDSTEISTSTGTWSLGASPLRSSRWMLAAVTSSANDGDPDIVVGLSTHVSPEERAAFASFADAGLVDVVRPLVPQGYTYWDYKRLKFPRNEGIRIDFILGSRSFADLVTAASIHRDERKGDAPSDHVPVLVELTVDGEDAGDNWWS